MLVGLKGADAAAACLSSPDGELHLRVESALRFMARLSEFRLVFVFPICHLVSRWCHSILTLFRDSTPLRYCQGSDSSACHLRQRSPQLLRFAFSMFRLQPRCALTHRFNHHHSVSHEFQTSPRMSRLVAHTPPNRVRYPADHLFTSDCSPPHLTVTQLPSAAWVWFTTVRTCTELTKPPPGRTHFRAGGSPVGILLLDSGSSPGITQNRRLFSLDLVNVNTP